MSHFVHSASGFLSRRSFLAAYVLLVAATAFSVSQYGAESGDLWIGWECGRYTVAGDWATKDPHRTWQMELLDRAGLHLTFRDPFSQASRGYDPNSLVNCGWINQNWLSHVLLYKIRMAFGPEPADIGRGETLIVVFKLVQVVVIGLLVLGTARILGTHPAVSAGAAVLTLMVGETFFDVRPNTSSLLLASVMMILWAARSRSRTGTVVYGMLPLMALWANMHGGFVYALMAFVTICVCELVGGGLRHAWPRWVVPGNRRKTLHLFVCTALLFVVPAVFSPFGIRNLFHPLLVSVGADAKVFRTISEWQPTWQQGFGDVQPFYILFSGFVILGGLWCVLWVRLRPPAETCGQSGWPRLDMAEVGLVSLTLLMGMTTRRFVPLAGIVVSPYLARTIQEVAFMAGRSRMVASAGFLWSSRKNVCAAIAAGLSAAVGVLVLATSRGQMVELYKAFRDGGRDGAAPFKHIAAVSRHPVQAAQFLNANEIAGVVLNDWVDGGFIAFQQTPDPRTGEPRCKVYVDGRSQAAYDVEQYLWWKVLHGVPSPSYPQEYGVVEAEARRRGLDPTGIVFLEQLRREYLDGRDSRRDEDEQPQAHVDAGYLLGLALSHPVAYDRMLCHENINVVLLPVRARADFKLLDELPDWAMVYVDDRDCIFLRKDCSSNRRLLEGDPNALAYPGAVAHAMSVGLRYCRDVDPARCRQGVRLLMSINDTIPRQYIDKREYVPGLADHVFEHGVRLGMHEEVWGYLMRQLATNERAAAKGPKAAYRWILVELYRKMADLATMNWQYDQARHFAELARQRRMQ